MNKIFALSVIAAGLALAGCGKDKAAKEAPSKATKTKAAKIALSTAPIDVVKTAEHGMLAEGFNPCVYEPAALVSHFGFPADTNVSQQQNARRCSYRFQRDEMKSSAPFANFMGEFNLRFNHGIWESVDDAAQYDADISDYLSTIDAIEELPDLGARVIRGTSPRKHHSEGLSGFPIGGNWSASLSTGAVTARMDGPPLSPVYQVDFAKFHALAANLNARLKNPSTVIPE